MNGIFKPNLAELPEMVAHGKTRAGLTSAGSMTLVDLCVSDDCGNLELLLTGQLFESILRHRQQLIVIVAGFNDEGRVRSGVTLSLELDKALCLVGRLAVCHYFNVSERVEHPPRKATVPLSGWKIVVRCVCHDCLVGLRDPHGGGEKRARLPPATERGCQ